MSRGKGLHRSRAKWNPAAVAALASGETLTSTAKAGMVCSRTLDRWVADPAFMAEVAAARREFTSMILWRASAPATEAIAPAKVAVLSFPTIGPEATWTFTATMLTALAESFIDIDVLASARRCLNWLVSSPSERKTANQMPTYVAAWIAREAEADAREHALYRRRQREIAGATA